MQNAEIVGKEKPPEVRDYLADQIGWSVRRLIPFGPEITRFNHLIIDHFPPRLIKIILPIMSALGLILETGQPERLFNTVAQSMGLLFLEKYGHAHNINTVNMPASYGTQAVHTVDFEVGKIPVRAMDWNKQVDWARKVSDRPECYSDIEISEAATIIGAQKSIEETWEKSKLDFIKRGLPFPPSFE